MYINNWTAQNAALPTELSLRQVGQSQLDKGESMWPHHGVLVTAALPSHPSHLHTNRPLTFGFGWGFLMFWFGLMFCCVLVFWFSFLNQRDCIIAQNRWEYHPLPTGSSFGNSRDRVDICQLQGKHTCIPVQMLLVSPMLSPRWW